MALSTEANDRCKGKLEEAARLLRQARGLVQAVREEVKDDRELTLILEPVPGMLAQAGGRCDDAQMELVRTTEEAVLLAPQGGELVPVAVVSSTDDGVG